MKYFVVADVHGFYHEMLQALHKAGYDVKNPNYVLVSCGDAFDRGPRPEEILDFFINTVPSNRRILIRGNHEDLMEAAICRGYFAGYDGTNGTKNTALLLTRQFSSTDALIEMRTNTLYNEYIANCHDYHETSGAVFVHGWIPHHSYAKGFNYDYMRHDYIPNWREVDSASWQKARWYNGMESWADGVREPGKTIFCGHWHTSWGHAVIEHDGAEWPGDINHKVYTNFKPFIAEGIVALDGCVPLTHVVNCYVLEDDPLPGQEI